MNIIRDGDQKYDAIIAKRNLTEQVLNYNQSMTICSHDALFLQNDEEMDDRLKILFLLILMRNCSLIKANLTKTKTDTTKDLVESPL